MIRLAILSDTHFLYNEKEKKVLPKKERTSNKISRISSIATKYDAIIIAGDLTDDGWDGKSFLCIEYGGDYDELGSFIKDCVEPLKNIAPVYLCEGNHDEGGGILGYKPVLKYIKSKYNNLYYMKILSTDLGVFVIISLGKYPNAEKLEWLKKIIQTLDIKIPILCFFHFNLEGTWSNWWSDEEKNNFYSVIKNNNIVALAVGHQHRSYIEEWKGIPVLSGAGDKYIEFEYCFKTNKATFYMK